MKLKYIFMSMVMAATAMAGFTSCSDDDDPAPANKELAVAADVRVKIGPETRIALPVEDGNGEYQAYSLDPEIADVFVAEDGQYYIEGFKNGKARIVVSDANNNYKQLVVAVYTTDEMKLNYTTVDLTTVINQNSRINGIDVVEGNGGYSISSSDTRVNVTIGAESGQIVITAASEEEPYSAVITIEDQTGLTADINITVSKLANRVKIGTDTREQLPIDASLGEYEVTMISGSDKATLVSEGGVEYIEGTANGTAIVKITQGETLRQLAWSVYTTDVMELSATSCELVSPLGIEATLKPASVTKGNGGYTISSDNSAVVPSINNAGEITLKVKARVEEYNATVTVTDCTGLYANIQVSVKATFDAFTDTEIDDIMALTQNTLWVQSGKFTYNVNSDFAGGWERDGTWVDGLVDGQHTFGWWEIYWGSDYGGHYIIYPEGTGVNEEVDATYKVKFKSWGTGSDTYNLSGKAKILEDSADKKVMIWWNVDMENEYIERGWIVKMKD